MGAVPVVCGRLGGVVPCPDSFADLIWTVWAGLSGGWGVEVAELGSGDDHTEGVEDGEEVDGLLQECSLDGCDESEAGGQHAEEAERHATDGALESDAAHADADVHEFVDTFEGGLEDDGTGGFGGNFAVDAEGDADGGVEHGGCVVDAVADVDGFAAAGEIADDVDFFFGAHAAVDVLDLHAGGEEGDLGDAVAGEEGDFADVVLGCEVIEEWLGIAAGLVFETEEGCDAVVHEDDTLEASGGGGKGGGDFGGDFFASGDPDGVAIDVAVETGTGGFGDI